MQHSPFRNPAALGDVDIYFIEVKQGYTRIRGEFE
jgi:hypothetical protein